MARFISLSLSLAFIISNLFVFAQKHGPVPMRMLVQEAGLASTPFNDNKITETAGTDRAAAITMHVYNNAGSDYLLLEVLGASKAMAFRLINARGEEMYAGTIRGTQLIETESWSAGTYYFLCGTKRETIEVTK